MEKELARLLEDCNLCGHRCGADRIAGELGVCAAGAHPRVNSHFSHMGEEPPISGENGSGTVFFSHCSLKCAYCQNYKISQQGAGEDVSADRLVEMMFELQQKGCHNINFVTPTHYGPSVISAVEQARAAGLDLPIVYNSGGYDSEELIEALDGVIDIYLVDMRYSSNAMAYKYSRALRYVEVNRQAVSSMFRQVGDLEVKQGIAARGMIVRLLILPYDISGTVESLHFIHDNLGEDVHLSIMSQFYPAWQAKNIPALSERISRQDYDAVVDTLEELNMSNGWLQPFEGGETDRFSGEKILEAGEAS